MPIGIYERKTKGGKGRECHVENHICQIPLFAGHIAICDEDRLEEVNKHNWCKGINDYAVGYVNGKMIRLHKFLYPEIKIIDHINRDRSDNRSCNLREVTTKQNSHNKSKRSDNKSGYIGVHRHGQLNCWTAQCNRIHLGLFENPMQAAKAYDKKARALFGEYAKTNF